MICSLQGLAEEFAQRLNVEAPDLPQPSTGDAISGVAPGSPPKQEQRVAYADYRLKGYHLEVTAKPEQLLLATRVLDAHGFALDAITGVDWMAQDQMEVVYDFFHPAASCRVLLRARVPRSEPVLPSIARIYPGADWHERETHDFFGIRFQGHANLAPLLLPEDANFHPLRKDFAT